MASRVRSDQLQAILTIVEQFPNGATLADITQALPSPPDQRTLQRWLGMMIEGERIIADESASPTRYRAVTTPNATALTSDSAPTGATPGPSLESPAATSATAGDATAPTPAPEPTPEKLLAATLPEIVARVLPRISAIPFLENQAMLYLSSDDARRSFVASGKARLDALTRDEATQYGIEPERYDFWRCRYEGPTAATDLAPPTGTGPTNAPGVAPTIDRETHQNKRSQRETSPDTADEISPAPKRSAHLPQPRTSTGAANPIEPARPVATARTTASPVASLQPTAAEIAEIVEPLRLGELRQRGMAVIKETVTRRRAAIAAIWGVVVVWGGQQLLLEMATHVTASTSQHFATLASAFGYLTFPAAGLPWLFFRWRDRRKQRQKLDGIDATTALLIGGVLTLIAGRFLASLLSTLTAFLP